VIEFGTLSDFAFFAGLDKPELERLATIAGEIGFERGDFICREGDPAQRFYLLLDGWADILVNIDPQGQRRELLATLTAGDIFGWSALVQPYIYTTSVVCASPVRAISFNGVDLLAMGEADLRLGSALMTSICQVIASRLRATRQQMISLFILS